MIHSPAISSVVPPQNYTYPTIPLKKKYSRVHRIVLDSSDAENIPNYENLTFKVNLSQEIQSENAMLYVESFHMVDSDLNKDLEEKPYKLHLRGLQQPLSYHSTSKTTSDVLVTLKGRTYTDCKFGIPLIDKRFFSNNTINIYFTSQDANLPYIMDQGYILTLLIVEDE